MNSLTIEQLDELIKTNTMDNEKEIQKEISEILKNYNMSKEDFDESMQQISISILLLMRCVFEGDNHALIEVMNSAGELLSKDGTEYQMQISLQPNKDLFIDNEAIKFRKITSETVFNV